MMINVEKKGKNLGGGGVVVKGGLVLIRLRMGGLMKTNLAKGSLSLSLRAMMNVFATFHKC